MSNAMAVAMKNKMEPVFIIGVNSGNSRQTVENFTRQNKIQFPVLVDTDRSFEKQMKVPEISRSNVWSTKVIHPNGKVTTSSVSVAETHKMLTQTAAWNIDPKTIPEPLHPIWLSLEFGNYQSVAKQLQSAAKSRNERTQAAGRKMLEHVNAKISESLQPGTTAAADGKLWEAYKVFSTVKENFQGYDLPESTLKSLKEMAQDDTVKKELAAWKKYVTLKQKLANSNPKDLGRNKLLLKRLIESASGTQVADEAQAFLDSF